MSVTCFIRYQIDPFQRDAFKTYADNWRLKADPEGRANFAFAQENRLILREERSFLERLESP